ncbi:hypothetical protein [Methermicoccus shengliensis]|uniref:Uncharacterized protein n=1 Tax=Methermicoccus shengliensis TaxID=660064 RepID=A0A832W069_9EURY|nr:hypothetical protein [Methermicoccus shengliensis]HIH70129.1 hypothetical protein [Methermicoccus shengliensis]
MARTNAVQIVLSVLLAVLVVATVHYGVSFLVETLVKGHNVEAYALRDYTAALSLVAGGALISVGVQLYRGTKVMGLGLAMPGLFLVASSLLTLLMGRPVLLKLATLTTATLILAYLIYRYRHVLEGEE